MSSSFNRGLGRGLRALRTIGRQVTNRNSNLVGTVLYKLLCRLIDRCFFELGALDRLQDPFFGVLFRRPKASRVIGRTAVFYERIALQTSFPRNMRACFQSRTNVLSTEASKRRVLGARTSMSSTWPPVGRFSAS